LRTERDIFHPKEIQKLLFSLEGEPEEPLISRLALRAMQRARYNTVNLGHFGLSADCYTHFTSPIRRYPDLQIHRIIRENLHGKLDESRIEHYEKILPEVTENCSALEQRATEAERDVDKLKKIEYMGKHLKEHFHGVISGVSAAGLFVTLDNTVEGLIPVRFLVDDYYFFDEVGYRFVGEFTHKEYTLGQTVDVIVFKVDKVGKFIDFMLEEFYHG
jgi:ribonuclease R